MEERLISRKEAAERLGVNVRTVDRLIQKGILSVRRIEARVLIRAADVDTFIRDGTPAQDSPQ